MTDVTCSMCGENRATTTYGLPVCQPCHDGLVNLDAKLDAMEAADPRLRELGARVEESTRRYLAERIPAAEVERLEREMFAVPTSLADDVMMPAPRQIDQSDEAITSYPGEEYAR